MTHALTFRLVPLAVAGALAVFPALAQDAAPAADQPAADQPATEQPAAPAPAAPAETAAAAEQDAIGQPYVVEVAGDWQIECIHSELEADPCRMIQLLLDQGNPAVRVEIVALPAGSPVPAVAAFYTPLATLLSEQLTLSVDGGPKSKHGFNYCTPQFCVAQVPFAPDAVAAFKRGNSAEAMIVPLQAPDQQVQLKMSLTGFTAGFTRLSELAAANAAAVQKARAALGQAQGQSGGN